MLLLLGVGAACLGCQGGETSKPLIGITSVYKVEKNGRASTSVSFSYVKAVAENGGVPVVLPSVNDEHIIRRYVRQLDGLVLVGGEDVPLAAYGQEPHETVKVIPRQRYDFERRLIRLWLDSGKPVLGVCLGMQFANVVAGGTLVQDIPSQVGTQVNHRGNHAIAIEPGSFLAERLGAESAEVLSNHHQAVGRPGEDLRVVARSEDGVVEVCASRRACVKRFRVVRTAPFVWGRMGSPSQCVRMSRSNNEPKMCLFSDSL